MSESPSIEKGKRKTACPVKELLSQFSTFENGPDYTIGDAYTYIQW
jgi:hypothetical protein